MTRSEFVENVTDFSELIYFCGEVGCSECDNVCDEDGMDSWVDENIRDWTYDRSWREVRDILNDLPTGYDWYHLDDWGDWEGIDDQFYDYKDRVLDWAYENDAFDTEEVEEEDDYVEEVDPEDMIPIEEEDVSLSDMFIAYEAPEKPQEEETNTFTEIYNAVHEEEVEVPEEDEEYADLSELF